MRKYDHKDDSFGGTKPISQVAGKGSGTVGESAQSAPEKSTDANTWDAIEAFERAAGLRADYIEKSGSGYEVKSESGKNLGHEPSKTAAEKRLAQVEYFKHKGGDDSTEKVDDMNNVNKPMTMSKSQETAGNHEGNPEAATPPMLEVGSKMDMAIYEKDGWEDAHMQNKDALEQSETAGGAVGKDPEAKHDDENASTAGGAVGRDPASKHDDGEEADPVSAFETASGFKSGFGGSY